MQKSHLKRHLMFRESETNKPIKCKLCCRRFSSLRGVKKHRRVHFPKTSHPSKEHARAENLSDIVDVNVLDSGSVIGDKKSYSDLNVATLIVENVGG